MIKSVYFAKLTNGDFVAFMNHVLTLYNRVSHPTLSPYVTALSDAVIDLNTAYRQERGSDLTKSVKELDKRRSNAIRGIKAIARAYAYHADSLLRQAAALLLDNMNRYDKRIDKLDYFEKTAAVMGLIRDWTNDVLLSDAINLLHLQDWQQELSATNTDFRAVFLDRVQEVGRRKTPPVSTQRPAITELYRTLKRQTLAYAQISPQTYSPIVRELEELISKFR